MLVLHQIQSSAVFFQFRGKGNASLKRCDTKQEVKAKETEMRGRTRVTETQGEGSGEGIVRELGMDTDTLLYLKWITSKDLLGSTGKSPQCYVATWVGREFGGGWIHACVWLGCFAVHLKLSHF